MDISERIQDEARRLLSEQRIDVVIGYAKGTLPLKTTPVFIRDVNEVECLIWNPLCGNNLSRYLDIAKGAKVGIVVKGCDGRSVLGLIKEGQINRENIVIIGVSCTGVLDVRRIEGSVVGEVKEAVFSDGDFRVRGDGFEKSLKISDFLYPSCSVCGYKTPPIYDVLVGEPVQEAKTQDEFKDIEEFESQPSDERWRFFQSEAERCIRCFACRQSCPLCYCEMCFVDQTQPHWFGKTLDPADTITFHLIRAYHSAGRCVDCGACERACPVGLSLRRLTKRAEREVLERFGYRAGLDLDTPPPLSAYREDDDDSFIK
jgi:ferredoxin